MISVIFNIYQFLILYSNTYQTCVLIVSSRLVNLIYALIFYPLGSFKTVQATATKTKTTKATKMSGCSSASRPPASQLSTSVKDSDC